MSGLDREFTGRVVGKNADATTPEAKSIVRALGFESHGVVIRSPEGKVLWTEADHDVKMEDVRAALGRLLEPPRK